MHRNPLLSSSLLVQAILLAVVISMQAFHEREYSQAWDAVRGGTPAARRCAGTQRPWCPGSRAGRMPSARCEGRPSGEIGAGAACGPGPRRGRGRSPPHWTRCPCAVQATWWVWSGHKTGVPVSCTEQHGVAILALVLLAGACWEWTPRASPISRPRRLMKCGATAWPHGLRCLDYGAQPLVCQFTPPSILLGGHWQSAITGREEAREERLQRALQRRMALLILAVAVLVMDGRFHLQGAHCRLRPSPETTEGRR